MLYQLSYWPISGQSLELHLFVNRMLFAPLAIFFQSKLFGRILLVFGRVIVSSRTLFTAKMDDFSHRFSIPILIAPGRARKRPRLTR